MKDRSVSGKTRRPNASTAGALALCVALGFSAIDLTKAEAGETIDLGDGRSFTIGAGLRTSFGSVSSFAPGGYGNGTTAQYNLDSFRIYTGATLNEYIKATFNTERSYGNGPIGVLDAYVQFEPMNEVNVWVGQMLPPSDRANLDGPYYLSEWYYPGVVSQYPSRFYGRDLGGTVWGKLFDKKLVYSVGVFAGHNLATYNGVPGPGVDPTTFGFFGPSNQAHNPLFAGRVVYNFWDPEPDPAYYEASTYYGKVDVLSIGVAGMFQQDGVGTSFNSANYGAWNVDGLMEKKLGDYGVITLEGAYYNYNTGGIVDVPPNYNNAGLTANIGGVTQGNGYLASAAYLIPYTFGYGIVQGQFQPYARYQHFDATVLETWQSQIDFGVNYVIKPHDLVVTLDCALNSASNTHSGTRVTLGLQVQL
ncbi:conserved hypothetical protein [Methylocella silvestris BL2]|uniref:Porin n=1 Tax=Methylocella silvestris (strain DSM 15510 / CIP 108128 / LMG 27833 / NCIMB 13906 / BL2) TaxID=395965 RepID=B8EPT8_METSB|nr:hypothetical protein [Methylocella silvestris]ACK50942.1 conserved hypothetical protein [Methylocella silvestris BL2]